MNNVNQHITRLDWDSDFFGIEVGRLSTKQEELHLKDSLFDLVYIHSKKKLINTSIPCYDRKITFKKKLVANTKISLNPAVKEYGGELTKELLNLAITSGIYSRIKLDTKLSSRFEELYTIWIKNSLNGLLADYVFTYEKYYKFIGFVSLK